MTASRAAHARFVGRRSELAELRARLADAGAGHGSMVCLTGDAGMGKSRLAEELAARAGDAGVPTVWGRCPADPGAPPLWPLSRVLEALPGPPVPLPDTTRPRLAADADTVRFTRAVAICDALVAAARPAGLLVVIEDLHWADSATWAVLTLLAGEVAGTRLLVLVTTRPGAPATAELTARAGVTRIHLEGLVADNVAAYLAGVVEGPVDVGYVDFVLRQTAGVCLLVQLVTRLLAERANLAHFDETEVRAALAGRVELKERAADLLRRLSDGARTVLDAASVDGEEFATFPLAVVCGLPLQQVQVALDEGVAAGLLRAGSAAGIGRFVHALLRDGVYDGLDPAQRRTLHRRYGAALTPTFPDPHRVGQVARHLSLAAADPAGHRAAAQAQRRAGDVLAALAPREAAAAFESAARHLRAGGEATAEETASILVELAEAQFRTGAFRAAFDNCRTVFALLEDTGWALLTRAALVIDGVFVEGGEELAAMYARALTALPEGAETERAELLARSAYQAAEDGLVGVAERRSAEALALAERTGSPVALHAALRARHRAMSGPDHTALRLALGQRMLGLGERGLALAALWGRLWRIDAAFELGNLAAVDEELAEVAAIAARLRSPLARWHLARVRAAREGLVGSFAVGLQFAHEAQAIAADLQDPSLGALHFAYRHYVAFVRGTAVEPDGQVAPIAAFTSFLRNAPAPLPIMRTSLLVCYLLSEERAEAEALLTLLVDALPAWPRDGRWVVELAMLADVAADLGDAAAAQVLYPLLEPYAALMVCGGGGAVACGGSVSATLGRLALTCGRLTEAEAHLDDAGRMEQRMGARAYVALTRLYRAQLLQAQGRRPAALAEARVAETAFVTLDMPGRIATCAALISALRVDPHRSGLTAREAEIATLVTEGLTNQLIAQRLFLSERTVESHVSHVLTKIGGSTRGDIIRWSVTG